MTGQTKPAAASESHTLAALAEQADAGEMWTREEVDGRTVNGVVVVCQVSKYLDASLSLAGDARRAGFWAWRGGDAPWIQFPSFTRPRFTCDTRHNEHIHGSRNYWIIEDMCYIVHDTLCPKLLLIVLFQVLHRD